MRVDFARSEQRQPEYLATNPKGRVPALVADATFPAGVSSKAFRLTAGGNEIRTGGPSF